MKLFKYFLCGLIFGIYNEVFFHPLWDYSDVLKPFLFDDIPILFILGWAGIVTLILHLTDRINRLLMFKDTPVDMVLFVAICFPLEIICSRVGLWSYNYELHENPIGAFIGYLFASFIISRFVRYEQKN